MKKILAIALCLCMVLCAVACGGTKEADYKLGLGVVVSTASSKEGNAQVDATIAAVVTDAEGKIVSCRIDVAQNKMAVADGAVDTAKTFETKMELGSRYGMEGKVDNDGNGVMLEWDAQAKAFEAYVVGKTGSEVAALQTQEAGGHQIAVDTALLEAGCSMQITDFMAAVAKACADEQGMNFKAVPGTFTLGVAAKTGAADSKAATADAEGLVAMYSDIACAVVADGKVIATLNDAIQPKINVTTAGAVTPQEFKGTKRELKEGYNMAAYGAPNVEGGTVKEWYIQSAAFSNHVIGMTAAEIAGMQTKEVNAHQISVDEALLSAGCTMQITGICAVVAQAANNAR
ncbi:MAG: hypothetical protein IKK74_02300 [Clostridia bacterium]|nr:hypothetical protein [Clostridia bacterium]